MTRRRIRRRLLAVIVVSGAACWLGGFIWFVNATRRLAEPPPPHTDGIVALTGGPGRVELALRLLANGRADKLLVSGIGGGTDLATLSRLAGIDSTHFGDRITLGRYAASTRGNGVETAAWAKRNCINSLIVVTAAYHMPRAMAELRHALPGIRLYPMAVHTEEVESARGFKLEAAEYTKYLLTASGLSAWFPRREAAFAVQVNAGT